MIKTEKLYQGTYKEHQHDLKIGQTGGGMGTRASGISRSKRGEFKPMIYAKFKDLTKPDIVLLESQLRVLYNNTKCIKFVETSNDHFTTTLSKQTLINMFTEFVNNCQYKENLVGIIVV